MHFFPSQRPSQHCPFWKHPWPRKRQLVPPPPPPLVTASPQIPSGVQFPVQHSKIVAHVSPSALQSGVGTNPSPSPPPDEVSVQVVPLQLPLQQCRFWVQPSNDGLQAAGGALSLWQYAPLPCHMQFPVQHSLSVLHASPSSIEQEPAPSSSLVLEQALVIKTTSAAMPPARARR